MFQHSAQDKYRFLVPLDGSRLAEAVLPTVEHLASRFHAKVTLLHVMEQHAPATIHGERHLTGVAEARAYLEEVAARLRSTDILVETHVHEDREENVARSIAEHAQESQSDLVIMCTHGRSGLRGLLFGSIAQQALRRGTYSILLVLPREDGNAPIFDLRRILVPLDGTAAHEPALPVAMTLARAFDAEMHLVLVIPTLATLSGSQALTGMLLPTTMRAVLDLAQQGALDYLEQAAFHRLLPFLGPAFIACVAYIDPGNFATNIQGGASFGYMLVWVIVASNLMAMLIQTLSAKLGIRTGCSTGREHCTSHYWTSELPTVVGSGRGANCREQGRTLLRARPLLPTLPLLPSRDTSCVNTQETLSQHRLSYSVSSGLARGSVNQKFDPLPGLLCTPICP